MILFISIIFAAGILLAGSESDYFPLPNLVGLILVGIVGIVANLMSQSPRSGAGILTQYHKRKEKSSNKTCR